MPKPTRKPIPSLGYFKIKHHGCMHGSTLLEGYCSWPKLFNTPAIPLSCYSKNTLGPITFLLKLGGVFHSPTKTYKQCNTLLGVFSKHHGLNVFCLNYQRGIVNGKKYSMHMQHPLQGILEILWVL
jgi:hypothetical protein